MNTSLLFGVRIFCLVFLGAWLLASICSQIFLVTAVARNRPYRGLKWDIFKMIPRWAFYSMPPTQDSVLLYRDKLTDGRLTPWKNAWAFSPTVFRGIWSPEVRKSRAIHVWLPLLKSVAQGRKDASECFISDVYVSAAMYIAGIQPTDSIEFRQFMVARISGIDREEPAEILFVSPLFRLETAA